MPLSLAFVLHYKYQAMVRRSALDVKANTARWSDISGTRAITIQ